MGVVMDMVVYLDVLLLTNLWLDYAMLETAAHLTHTPMKHLRGLCSALLGALCALSIFLPPLHPVLTVALRILTAAMMSAAAFGLRNLRLYAVQTAVLFGVSALFCGVISAVSVRHYSRNAVVYTDVSLLVLLLGSGLAAAAAVLWERRRSRMPRGTYRVHLKISGCDFSLPALADTGNTLCDVFTGRPVIVCPAAVLDGWLSGYRDTESAAQSCKGFRMLPVHTVAGMRLLPAFLPDSAAIQNGRRTQERPLDVLIAVTDTAGERAIVPANIL